MLTDHHCHILPGIDDGAKTAEISAEMVKMMRDQGVERIIATPHFYLHREKSISLFQEKRKKAYEELMEKDPAVKDIMLGAEVAIEHGLSKKDGIERLRIQGTGLILLEFPYTKFSDWMIEEIDNVVCGNGLKPVIAHIHRYLRFFSKAEMERVLALDAVFQINNEAFGSFSERRFVKKLIKDGYPLIFGSDAHNLDNRKPNWDLLLKKCDGEVVESAGKVLDMYIK